MNYIKRILSSININNKDIVNLDKTVNEEKVYQIWRKKTTIIFIIENACNPFKTEYLSNDIAFDAGVVVATTAGCAVIVNGTSKHHNR